MVAIIDFGGQYTHLIARRIRQLKVRAEIFSSETNLAKIENLEGIILSGGPSSVYDKFSPKTPQQNLKIKVPILGICYGHHFLAKNLGGLVKKSNQSEFGREIVNIKSSKLFTGLNKNQKVWFSHGDQVSKLPEGFKTTGETKNCPIAAFEGNNIFGVQFHPEVTHTDNGLQILDNFLKICKAERSWNVKDQINDLVLEIKQAIGKDKVLIAVSGGVDSLVAATLIHKAVKNQIYPVFVDSGLLRKNEVKEVRGLFKELKFSKIRLVGASNLFLKRLRKVTDPERKRKIIGKTFIEVFTREAERIGKKEKVKFLAQGTIYPDRIESAKASSGADKIKSHHNLIIPKTIKFKLIEPLAEFYKDEVREIGADLGLPKEKLWRHPFPGPGLAIRIIGDVTAERLKILKEADAIYLEELHKAKIYDQIWQAFAVLLTNKSVGVIGDRRNYGYIISLRAVTSFDGMTADWFKFDPEVLEKISARIVNEVKGVSRVVYDITQKPPATIEYE